MLLSSAMLNTTIGRLLSMHSAKAVESRIWAIWLKTPSDTAALLMTRARVAMDAKEMDVAQKLLDAFFLD